jgi:hypothetical protein
MISLGCGHVMEEMYQFLADEVLMVERKVLDGTKDDRIGKDGSVERMGGVGG